ncbi:MAG: NAD(P)-binding domain-containing protein [Alphaproteobacteria bacterium]|nr:NAD(P)-binding domain-containing protein [Alphaproteobacteria bacterium]
MLESRPRCVITHRVFPETVTVLEQHAAVIQNEGCGSWPNEKVLDECQDAAAVMTFMPDHIDRAFIEACPKLKVVAGALKGYDNIDLDACRERGIWVSIVPDFLTSPTAELAIGLAIGIMRNVPTGDAWVRSGRFTAWRPTLYGTGFAGAAVGIVGFGGIGRAIADRLRGFGAAISYTDVRPASPDLELELEARFQSLNALLAESDVVFLCTPLTAYTKVLIDADALAKMKPGAFLINPARGSLVDEEAVADALKHGQLAGYAADAFAFEDWARNDRPTTIPESLLRISDRTLFTPHLGSATNQARRMIERRAAANIIDALSGRCPRDAVDTFPPAKAIA